jgi:UDP-glucuronate 4-epimerase
MLRFFTVYGPRQRPDLAIHKFMKLIYEGKSIPFYGNGSTSRDYTYVDDIVDGILKSLKFIETRSSVFEIINLGNNKPVKLNDMVKAIENVLNKKANLDKLPIQQGDVDITFADISKAETLLGYKVKTHFQKGIYKFSQWFKGL